MSTTEDTKNTSTASVISSIIFNGVLLGAFTLAFLLLRIKFKRIYQPKSAYDLVDKSKKPEPLPPGVYQWLIILLKKKNNFIIRQAGIDGYFFLRYLFFISAFCLAGMILVYPIIIPINITGGNGNEGLDRLSFSNINSDNNNSSKYYAHIVCSWIFNGFLLFVIYRELIYYTNLRAVILSTPNYATRLPSRVVLFQSVPKQYLNEDEFKKLFTGIRKVWITRADHELGDKVEERDSLARNLESALNKLLKSAVKTKIKADKKNTVLQPIDEIVTYVPQNKRPTHKLFPIFGKSVDTINYAKVQLKKLNQEIIDLQLNHQNAKPMNSVFVEFENQYLAQLAYQSVAHHTPLSLGPCYIGISPDDIYWRNMRMFWYERLVRSLAAAAAIIAVIVLWAFPVAFVGMISNITSLTNKLTWLRWIYDLPDVLLGLITSLLPTIMLALLMLLLPFFIRFMAKISGSPTIQHIEYYTQQSFFGFQVIQVFLVTTISSSATAVVTKIIDNPTSSMSLLAENLPKSSNFYISYVVLQGFTISGALLLNYKGLLFFYAFSFLFDSSVRDKWTRFNSLEIVEWGTTFPIYTNLAVIIMAYSIISPIILLFGFFGFGLLYIAYLHSLCYVQGEGPDSRGMHYPRALYQTLVGVYLGQVCLLGLFAVGGAWGPIILQAICIGVTAFIHSIFNRAFDHLNTVVPVDTMRPLDGVSDTPSFSFHPKSPNHSHEQEKPTIEKVEGTAFDKEISDANNNSSIVDLSVIKSHEIDDTARVPLLADGDDEEIPHANPFVRFFQPHIYCSYKFCKQSIPSIYKSVDHDDQLVNNEHAYDYPAVAAKPPYLWIPADPMGLSKHEIKNFEGIVPITDEGAHFDEKGNIVWTGKPPEYHPTEEYEYNLKN
ncbi:Rsn1p [Ascoidea rubescens DSM 1968]|uniref:DUF221-domain-containing protein n=1 Tax=Ascoidea rubescens DSM 1968 TaxID=1344418 RepID=A0A1D2VL82_9ASCO|nr:DUF221-domain-containing protein [Ascoidea rubescens DSM 1968]ODV62363.1 DUF221-domain-containing protein [Ascoidea rubescens DSM 1968]